MKKRQKTIQTIKLVIVFLMAVAIAFSALAPVFGEENITDTEAKEELRDIKDIAQEIVKDLAIPAEYTTRVVPITRIPNGFNFAHDLRERATGELVRNLQIVLNADPQTRIASSGTGSLGSETNYFGAGTRDAILRFQRKHGIAATGFVGAQTRAKINELVRSGITVREEVPRNTEMIRNKFMELVRRLELLRERMNQRIQEREQEQEEGNTEEEENETTE